MAPKQASTPGDITAADVYTLGVTLLFALTDRFPARPTRLMVLAGQIISPAAQPDLGGLPEEFAQVVPTTYAYKPGERSTVAQVSAWLAAL